MAGMAFANAFLGICHSMAHKLGAMYHVPHGLANALLLPHVYVQLGRMCRGSRPLPTVHLSERQGALRQDSRLSASRRQTPDEKVEKLIDAISNLSQVNIPKTIKEAGVPEKEFFAKIDELSEKAFDDSAQAPIRAIADLRNQGALHQGLLRHQVVRR